METRTITLEVLGEKIPLKTSESEALTTEVVSLVEKKIADVSSRFRPGVPAHRLVLVALLEVAEEYVKSKDRVQVYQRGMVAKAKQILSQVELGQTGATATATADQAVAVGETQAQA